MRIEYLRLPAFGKFTDHDIQFSPEHGLHLIYGRNEAGKSTLLRAVSHALFGIPRDSSDDFLHSSSSLRIEAGLRLDSGASLAFRRRRGIRNTLRDLNEQPLDEALLAPYTCGLQRSEFENMFGLDHLRLREGGRQLLESGGSLGESLFEAASGLHELRRIVEDLESQAEALFTPTAKVREVNKLAGEFRDQKKAVSAAALSAREFQRLEEEYRKALARLESLDKQLRDAERHRQKLLRIQRTKPLLAEREQLLAELNGLGALPHLAPDSQERYNQHTALLRQAQEVLRDAQRRTALLQEEMEELHIPQGILEQEAIIDELQQGLGQYRQVSQDLPRLLEQIEAARAGALAKLRELSPQAQDLQNGESYRIALHLQEAVAELAERFTALQVELEKAKEAQLSRESDTAATRNALAQFGSLVDTSKLQALVNEISKAGDLEQALQDLESQLRELQTTLEFQHERLPLWQGTLADLARAELPLPATTAAFVQEAGELGEEIRALLKEIKNGEERLAALQRQLAELSAAGEIPSEESLQKARRHRDIGWQLVRRSWLDGDPDRLGEVTYCADKPLPEAYEQAVIAADQAADRLREASDQAARRSALEEQRATADQELRARREELSALKQREEVFYQRWKALWSPLGVEPLSPQEMESWLNQCQALISKYEDSCRLERAIQELRQRIGYFTQSLQAALTELGRQPQGGLAQLLAQAQAFCEEVTRRRGAYESLQQRLEELEMEVGAARRRVEALLAEKDSWQVEWEQLMKELRLPAVTTPESAQKFLKRAGELIELLDKLAENETMKGRYEHYLAHYRQRAQEAALRAGLHLEQGSATQVVEALVQAGKQAASAAAARREKERQLEVEQRRMAEAELQISQAEDVLAVLVAEAGVETREELEEVLRRHGRALELRKRLEERETELLRGGDGLALADLTAEASGMELDAISYDLQELEADLEGLTAEKNELHEHFGVLKKEYEEKVEGSTAAAAQAAEEAQAVLAEMAGAVEKYLQLRTASLVLQRAIERYREEHQDPVLQRAGRIFAQLADSSFQGLDVDYDEQGNPVIAAIRGGELVGAQGMSDGTQDQLYLALRLASIENFLEQGESMPFIGDDLLVNFDDYRAAAALRALAELAQRTQVILFTHHLSVVRLAQRILPDEVLSVHYLGDVPELEEVQALQLA